MAGFDAGAVVEPLDYDFTTIKAISDDVRAVLQNAKGTIREPSDAAVQRLIRSQLAAAREIGITPETVDPTDQKAMVELARAVAKQPEEKISQMSGRMVGAAAELCDGAPTLEEIQALPQRIQNAFIAWLIGTLTNPEFAAGGTKPSLAVVRAG
jgi:hypothetical protein